MNKKPLVSIVIPAYNTEEYIKEMLECVVRQTYQNIQIIVVDDGSTDNTYNIVKNTDDQRIEVIELENGGASRARNIGIEKVKGEKLFLWDSDDIIEADAIQKCLDFAEENKVNAVLYGYADYVDGVKCSSHVSELRKIYRNEEIVKDLIPHFLGHTFVDINDWILGKHGLRKGKEHTALWRIMLDVTTVKNSDLKFDHNLTLGEDTKFINEYLLYESSVGYLDECLYYLRRRSSGANMTNSANPSLMMQNKLKLIEARKEIDGLAEKLTGINTNKYWNGTVVFSAVQLAIRFSKNKTLSTKDNIKQYRIYMENEEVKRIVQSFIPALGLKGLPFYLVKGSAWKVLFYLCKAMPSKLIGKIG